MSDTQPIMLLGVMSPNVVKVGIMLEELSLPYALRYTSVFQGDQFTPEFLAMNPMGKVPVLLDPALGRPLFESGAILIWLAEHYGDFLPQHSVERYEVIQWLMVQMALIGPMLGQYNHFRLLPEGSEPYAHARYGTLAETLYRRMDERLAEREWVAGDAYSIADIAMFPWMEYLDRHDLDLADYPGLKRWRGVVEARPAVTRAKARMTSEWVDASQESIRSATPTDLDRFFGRGEKVPAMDYSAVKTMR